MNVFAEFAERVRAIVRGLDISSDLADADLARVVVEPPRDPDHGDLATNAALVLAKPARMKPRDLAEKIVEGLKADGDVESVEIAGPGFVNIRLKSEYWTGILGQILKSGTDFGRSTLGGGVKSQRRIRLGQSDRPDACGALSRRRRRRCSGEFAGLLRL